jgi:hypothetical protein
VVVETEVGLIVEGRNGIAVVRVDVSRVGDPQPISVNTNKAARTDLRLIRPPPS